MTLKKKLTWGLGFLFFIIFALAIFSSYQIGMLSKDAENILKDNYNTLVYSKNMNSALEDMRTAAGSIVFNPVGDAKTSDYMVKTFEAGRIKFEDNLKSEQGNITEIHEREYVEAVEQGYSLYANLCARILKGEGDRALYFNEYLPAYEKLRHAVSSIHDLNMQAVERKSEAAKRDSVRAIKLVAGIGVFGVILAFGYFWYFPFYISNSIAYLADRMKALLKKSGIVFDIKTEDEAFVILQGISLLDNRLGPRDNAEEEDTES
jgi:hypothetical protein